MGKEDVFWCQYWTTWEVTQEPKVVTFWRLIGRIPSSARTAGKGSWQQMEMARHSAPFLPLKKINEENWRTEEKWKIRLKTYLAGESAAQVPYRRWLVPGGKNTFKPTFSFRAESRPHPSEWTKCSGRSSEAAIYFLVAEARLTKSQFKAKLRSPLIRCVCAVEYLSRQDTQRLKNIWWKLSTEEISHLQCSTKSSQAWWVTAASSGSEPRIGG